MAGWMLRLPSSSELVIWAIAHEVSNKASLLKSYLIVNDSASYTLFLKFLLSLDHMMKNNEQGTR